MKSLASCKRAYFAFLVKFLTSLRVLQSLYIWTCFDVKIMSFYDFFFFFGFVFEKNMHGKKIQVSKKKIKKINKSQNDKSTGTDLPRSCEKTNFTQKAINAPTM